MPKFKFQQVLNVQFFKNTIFTVKVNQQRQGQMTFCVVLCEFNARFPQSVLISRNGVLFFFRKIKVGVGIQNQFNGFIVKKLKK